MKRRVVVTGMGLISPLGCTKEAFWKNLNAGKCAIQKFPQQIGSATNEEIWSKIPARVAAQVPQQEFTDLVKDLNTRNGNYISNSRMQRFMQYAVASAQVALDDANWHPKTKEEQYATGVAIGSGVGSLEEVYENQQLLQEGNYRKITPFMVPRLLYNLAAGYISIQHKLMGPNHCVTTACATGANSIGDAFRFIQHGDCDVMVAGGTESCLNPLAFAGFCRAHALCSSFNDTPEKASRPFDKQRNGFVMGDGAGVVVLEEYEHAKKRGAKIYAEVKAYALAGDAHHITAPSPDGSAAIRVMKSCLTQAGIAPNQVQYINAHATSTPAGDKIEYSAIKTLFGSEHCKSGNLLVSSIKGAIGHLLGAAGAVESIATILSIQHNLVPPTLNFESLDEENKLDEEQRMILGGQTAKEHIIDHALSNSFGFGGTNASLLFAKVNE